MPDIRHTVTCAVLLIVALIAIVALSLGVAAATIEAAPTDESLGAPDLTNASEEPYVEPVPEPGDPYYEARDPDGNWISYANPRDEYRSPYLGQGSGKICVTPLDSDGNVIVGESIPDTTVTIPTGESLEWHSQADPITVEFPLTENYERPLDADQFGTNPDLPQGDGYLDSHCIEVHGMSETSTVEYGEAEVDGEHADRVEVVGYHQLDRQSWESDVDPIEDAVGYEEAGGGWTYDPDHSHGQAVVVLQLDTGQTDDETGADDDDTDADASNDTDDESDRDDSTDTVDDTDDESDRASDDEPDGPNEPTEVNDSDDDLGHGDDADSVPGFGIVAALLATVAAILASIRLGYR